HASQARGIRLRELQHVDHAPAGERADVAGHARAMPHLRAHSLSRNSGRRRPLTGATSRANSIHSLVAAVTPVELIVNIDGGARGNPGPAGAGVVVQEVGGSAVFEAGYFLGEMTNNMAEYHGLLRGL